MPRLTKQQKDDRQFEADLAAMHTMAEEFFAKADVPALRRALDESGGG